MARRTQKKDEKEAKTKAVDGRGGKVERVLQWCGERG